MDDLTLRKATLADAQMVYNWRNSEIVRKVSFNSSAIKLADHMKWFETMLLQKNKHYLIAEYNAEPVGVISFDIIDDEATVNIFLNPEKIGQGLGAKILVQGKTWIAVHVPAVKKLFAKILPDNIASKKAFEQAGYAEYYLCYKCDLSAFAENPAFMRG